jgi:hypothetical protein
LGKHIPELLFWVVAADREQQVLESEIGLFFFSGVIHHPTYGRCTASKDVQNHLGLQFSFA